MKHENVVFCVMLGLENGVRVEMIDAHHFILHNIYGASVVVVSYKSHEVPIGASP